MSAAPITSESVDLLEAQLKRTQKLLNGLTVTVCDALETVAQLKDLILTTDGEESENGEPVGETVMLPSTEDAESNPDEWVQLSEVLPPEGETVYARWHDGTERETFYRKSVEYPGAFVFYDLFGQAVMAPKEWLLAGGAVRASARNID